MRLRYFTAFFYLFALVFSASCSKVISSGNKADATFYGGSEPVAFKVRLAHGEITNAFDEIDNGELEPASACQMEFQFGACADHLDAESCGDLIALRSNPVLLTAATDLLANRFIRENIRRAIRDSRFEIVDKLEASGRHSVAQAPIGSTAQPVRYLGSALENKVSLVHIVFHEQAHVSGFDDETEHSGYPMHDILSAAGLCLMKMVRVQEPAPSPSPSVDPGPNPNPNPEPPPVTDPLPSRNYTGLYDLEISGRNHLLVLEQLSDGTVRGSVSGIPGIVPTAEISGRAKKNADGADQIDFTWNHGTSFARTFTGILSAVSLQGTALNQAGNSVAWQAVAGSSLFAESFASPLGSKWSGSGYLVQNGQLVLPASAGLATLLQSDLQRKDGRISAYVSAPQQQGDKVGFVARMGTGGKGYWGGLVVSSHGVRAEIWRNTEGGNGNWRKIHNGSDLSDASGLLEFEVRGQNLRVYLNGVLVDQHSDSQISITGNFGIQSNALEGGLNTLRMQP